MAYVTLSLFGQFAVTRDGQPVVGFRSAKVRALLAYLALEADHLHRRDALAVLLWPDAPTEVAHTYLRQALANLRDLLGESDQPYLLISREGVQVNRASDYELDVTTFRALLIACAQHAHRDATTCSTCARRLAEAVELYRGGLLEQFVLGDNAPFQEWAVLRGEQLHHQALGALARLADYCARRGMYEEAQHWARRQLELDPWREEAHQQLMDALWRNGQRSAALMQYERCRENLQEELGVEPAPDISALYQQIRSGEPPTRAAGQARQLPAATTSFVGRGAELAHIVDLVENRACRLVTVVGPGGIGKTRLVLQAAPELVLSFAHGVTFVALAAVRAADLLVPTLATMLNLMLTAGSDPRAPCVQSRCARYHCDRAASPASPRSR